MKAISEMGNCEMKSGQPPPSNYELVKAADAIVLAKVRRVGMVPPAQQAGTALLDSQAEFEIQTILKGTIEQKTLTFFGFEDRTERTRVDDFTKPTRAGAGPLSPPYPCGVPSRYRADAQYLLFLVHSKVHGAWTFPKVPVSRLNEEVDGEDSPWVQAVRRYIRIASLQSEEAEDQALRDLQAKARRADDPRQYPPALVADVERHFKRKGASGS